MRILVPLWSGGPPRTFYQEFHRGLTEALQVLGHEVVALPFAAPGRPKQAEAAALFELIRRRAFDAVIDLACWAYALSRLAVDGPGGGKLGAFEACAVPYLGLLLDQPHNQALNGIVAARLCAAYPDLGHAEQVRMVFPQLEPATEIFAPPAVRPAADRSAAAWSAGREIDVLYVGNLAVPALQRFWHQPGHPLWEAAQDPGYCDAFVECVLQAPERALHLSARAALPALGPKAPTPDLAAQFRAVEGHLRHRFRRDAVVALANTGVSMHLVGKGWETLALPPNVAVAPETDYDGVFTLAGRAKICLDASTYLDGANDRIFTYALSRAVSFTNAAGYLRTAFGADDGVEFYGMRELAALGERVRDLLAAPGRLEAAAERAKGKVLSDHTWQNRMGRLLAALG